MEKLKLDVYSQLRSWLIVDNVPLPLNDIYIVNGWKKILRIFLYIISKNKKK